MKLSWRIHLQWFQLLKDISISFEIQIYDPQTIKPHGLHSATLMETYFLFFRNIRNLCEILPLMKPIDFDNTCKRTETSSDAPMQNTLKWVQRLYWLNVTLVVDLW